MRETAVLLFVLAASTSWAQLSRATIFVEPQQGFETYIAAAFTKEGVPVDLVTDEARAKYVLKSIKLETTSQVREGKTAECLFSTCKESQQAANVYVQLIETDSTKIVWAYSVSNRKGSKSQEYMAESVAKHFRIFTHSSELYGVGFNGKQRSFDRGIY